MESPFPEHALPRVWKWIEAFRWRVADDFGPKTLDEFVQHVGREPLTWGVFRGDELGGLVTARPLSPVTVESAYLFKREFWGSEATAEGLRTVYAELFAKGYERIFGLVFADNAQLLGLMKRMGFEREGRLRAHTRRNGKPVDLIVAGLLKGDFEHVGIAGGIERPGGRAGEHGGGADGHIHVVEQRIDDDAQPPGIAA